ncbi:4'-phosphopantetheinyl transferase [Dysgonomonas sp. PH5-45]|uniref:4'-phosphopantetheinyl transferase family protein n=1 Tax=unclassified Dysgonomonas TaxID=2630389 RepID=UPI0024734BC0|nr:MULTISPECIES: 4'-phosphopantetheinyl transferase superfamily protein [unclassified Dysgonomonas]MDH6354629.1 4'-phosphopantetheinyl transferase [Dysgonomonas sp. PH5-45]MDH6387527.1 4'-phosphopantetheinyl transferase [Dysgonomonas sp. PH5-37]
MLHYTKQEVGKYILGVWKVEESAGELLSILGDDFTEKSTLWPGLSAQRVLERLAVRSLLKQLLGKNVEIQYTPSGKPYLPDNEKMPNISISHTKGYVAVLLSGTKGGIDIEQITNKVIRIESKFISEEESIIPENKLTHLLLHWSAKETMYKSVGEGGIDLKKHLLIHPFSPQEKGSFIGEYRKHTPQFFEIKYTVTPNYVLTYTY